MSQMPQVVLVTGASSGIGEATARLALFRVVAQDLVPAVVHGPGNVLDSLQEEHGLRDNQGSALLAIARNVGVLARDQAARVTR